MNIEEWFEKHCSQEFLEDADLYYGLSKRGLRTIAEINNIEDFEGVDFRLFSTQRLEGEDLYLDFRGFFEKDLKNLHDSYYICTRRFWK